MIYIVLGMHKSGTTLVSQILHHSAINMGEFDVQVSYDGGNQYERDSTYALNLNILGLSLDNYIMLNVPMPHDLHLTASQRAQMRKIIKDCNQRYPHWGFKDPRTCLLYPLWAEELPEHKIIAVYRAPNEIWPRYRYNGGREFYTNPRRAWNFINRWCEYNGNIVNYLQQTNMDFMVLSYRRLMAEPAEFERLQDFVSLKLNDQRRAGLYRSQPKQYPLLTLVTWLVRRKYQPEKIMAQLESLSI